MGGKPKTSTIAVTTRGQQYVYSRSKMEIALEDTLRLSGHHPMKVMSVTVMRCCLTYLAAATSQAKKQEGIYSATKIGDLILVIAIMS